MEQDSITVTEDFVVVEGFLENCITLENVNVL